MFPSPWRKGYNLITNDAGEVAIAYHQPADAFIDESRMPSRTGYAFITKRGMVSMSWVKPEDVEAVLAIRASCCNGQKRSFAYATEGQVGAWGGSGHSTNGGGNKSG